LIGLALLAATLCALVFPGAAQKGDVPVYKNVSYVHNVLSSGSWSGSGYDDDETALYLFRPTDSLSDADCQPDTGKPSKCAVEMMLLDMKTPPTSPLVSGAQYYDFTMMMYGDVFVSSPGANGYFQMPEMCAYMRNHSVKAMFNASNSNVEFEIVNTHADKLGCFNPGDTKAACKSTAKGCMMDRCEDVSQCYTAWNGKKFKGKFRMGPARADDAAGIVHHLEIVLSFPYKAYGSTSWSDYVERWKNPYIPQANTLAESVASWGTKKQSQIFRYSLTLAPGQWRGPKENKDIDWFSDRSPKILSVHPPFGPEEGGTIITIRGVEFPKADPISLHNASIFLNHSTILVDGVPKEWGGQTRECCETKYISAKEVTCRLPRVSCLHSNEAVKCPKPGAYFANQSVFFGIRPSVKGFFGPSVQDLPQIYKLPPPFQNEFSTGIDDFVSYEGEWELEDNDLYGGTFVRLSDRVPGETHLLQTDQKMASENYCCPVCSKDAPNRGPCKFTINQLSAGLYSVSIPNIMYPGGRSCATAAGKQCFCSLDKTGKIICPTGCICVQSDQVMGRCDLATNLKNISLEVGIERSTDPTGFTPATPLSVTSCIEMAGPCQQQPRISLRTSCKQLIWSTGVIESKLLPGQTVETHYWRSDSKCDRRMKCVGGPCLFTVLAQGGGENGDRQRVATTTEKAGAPIFQRRQSSPQVGLEVQYKNEFMSPDGFLAALANLLPDKYTDPRRLQTLRFAAAKSIPTDIMGSTFAVRGMRRAGLTFELSESSLCIPEEGRKACVDYNFIIYITSDGPMGDKFKVSLDELEKRSRAPKGDPQLREINLMRVCIDRSWFPDFVMQNLPPDCIKVQYPGFLQFLTTQIRTREEVWAYAKIGVSRTGGSDLDVTVDYETIELGALVNKTNQTSGGASRREAVVDDGYAIGLGVDFTSKRGQLFWLEGDSATKYIIIPIRWDGITELSETFQVKIFNAVNAKLATAPDPQYATVTIVGINDTPEPRYIRNMQAIIGAVCGAATALPCALLSARLIRSLRRGKEEEDDIDDNEDDDLVAFE